MLLFLAYFVFALLVIPQSICESKFQWRDLSDNELTQWYTPADLCVLENTEIKAFPQTTRATNCTKYSKGSRRMHCGVGMGSNNYPCYGPFGSARPSFKRGNNIQLTALYDKDTLLNNLFSCV